MTALFRSSSPARYLFFIGLVSLLAQVIFLRELIVAFYGVELITILALGLWLLGTGIGALLRTGRSLPTTTTLCRLFLLMGLMAPIWVVIIRSLRSLLGGISGTYLPFSTQLTALVLLIFPFGIYLGVLFQWAARHYAGAGGTLARAYGIESIGGMLGGMLSTVLFWAGVQNFTAALFCGLLSAGWVLSESLTTGGRGRGPAATVIILILVLGGMAPSLDHAMTRWSHPDLIASRDSPYGRVTISGRSGQVVVFENDVLSFETESADAEPFVHLAALQRPQVGKVLIIGGGVEGLVKEVLKYHPETVDYVEMNPVLPEMVRVRLPASFVRALGDKRVTVHTDDPIRFLQGETRYDLILSGMPEPMSGASNRFYTREFFSTCARRLSPGGILAFRVRSPENLWTRPMLIRNGGIYAALAGVFPAVRVFSAGATVFLASNEAITGDSAAIIRRFERIGAGARLVRPEYIRYVYTNDRTARIERQLKGTVAPPNTDHRPACYYYTGMIWLSKFIPGLINRPVSGGDASAGSDGMTGSAFIAAFCLSVFFFTIRRKARTVRFAVVFIAGFSGMILETTLILEYQAKAGALFQNMGMLFTVFMGGLGAGSLGVGRWMSPGGCFEPWKARRWGAGLLGGLVGLALILLVLCRTTGGIGAAGIVGLLFASGFMVSGLVAFAGSFGVKDQEAVISPLYGADLIGGCLGSAVGGLIWIPLFGMDATAGWLALICGAGLWMFAPTRR